MIVIDASVAVKWIVREAHHEKALDLLDREWERIAPDLILPEVANVLRKKLKKNEVSRDQVRVGLQGISVAIPRLVPSSELVNDAAVLSDELDHSVYDCFYLACALGRGVLLSADEQFARKCVEKGYGESVVVLGEIDLETLGVRFLSSSVTRDALDDIERLSKSIEGAIDSLIETAAPSFGGARKFRLVDAATVGPAPGSPAYLRLASELEALDAEQLSVIIALGWLGRSHHSATRWANLYENARQATAGGFAAHRAYFMAQTANVPAGLSKLKNYLRGRSERQ